MRLHECDVHLEWTRLLLASGEAGEASRHLEVAAKLVRETGYRRRTGEVEELKELLRTARPAGG